jgi:O-antigen/teichoic acid export membrane protein
VVLVALLGSGTRAEAGFQALATLAKGPVYVASGTVLVAFPMLRAGAARMREDVLAPALHSFEILAFTAAVVLATAPTPLVMLFLPERYIESTALLPELAAAGLGYGAVTVLATVLLALQLTRRTYLSLVGSTVCIAAGLGLGWAADGVTGLAVGAPSARLPRRCCWPWSPRPRCRLAPSARRHGPCSSPASCSRCCCSPPGCRCCGWSAP